MLQSKFVKPSWFIDRSWIMQESNRRKPDWLGLSNSISSMYLKIKLNISVSNISYRYLKKRKIGSFVENLSRVLKEQYVLNHFIVDPVFINVRSRKKLTFDGVVKRIVRIKPFCLLIKIYQKDWKIQCK